MASIQSLGIGSGLLTSDLVDQIIEAERAPTELRLDRREAEVEAKITAYGELRSALDKVQSSASSLASSNLIRGTTATSSDESALSATTNTTADPGNYRVSVDQVASAHTLASKAYTSVSDTVGTGTLTFNFGTTQYDDVTGDYAGFEQGTATPSVSIDITSGNNTLSGLRDTINKEVDGVTASLVFDGVGYRLLLSSDKTGEKSSMEIVASGDAGLQALAYNSAQNDPDTNLRETQRGEDALLRVNGLEIRSADNQVDEVIRGVTLNVNQVTTGSVSVNVSRNSGDVADRMESFIEAFNEFKFVYDEVNKYDPDEETAGLLLGDSTIRTAYSQIRGLLGDVVENLTGANFRSLADVGIETDQTQGFQYQFNRTKFEAALNANAEAMSGLLARQQVITDSQVRYVTQNRNTQAGSYEVFVEKAATQAQWQGLSAEPLSFSQPLVIGGSNDNFVMQLNGRERTVTLEQGEFTNGDDLALMIQNAISTAFSGTGQSASVAFDDTDNRLSITSSTFGSASTVNITSVDPTLANTLGLAPGGTGQVAGQSFSSLSDTGFGAATLPGTQAVAADAGIDFSSSPLSFDVTLTGTSNDGTFSVQLDEDWSDVLNTSGEVVTERDRTDVLNYIQSELNAAIGTAGVVRAEFNSADRLVLRTEPSSGAQTIELSNVAGVGQSLIGLQEGVGSSGVTLGSAAEFQVQFSNRVASGTSGLISVPAGTYQTGDELASAIEAQINADANVQAGATGAETTKGSRVLGANQDFASDYAQIQFNYNGTDYTVDVTSTDGDTITSIQNAIDAELGAGQITASLDGAGLVLTTNGTGSSEVLEVTRDGKGATTAPGSADLSTGIDFSAAPASFRLTVDGIDVDVSVDGDGTAGSNDADSNLSVIQQALDTALANAGGGGEFQAGDVIARLDDSNQLFFETRSKNGEPTLATFGASSVLELSATDANAQSVLGLSDQGPLLNGADGLGIALGQYVGFDSQANVSYERNEDGNGRFVISFGNDTAVELGSLNTVSAAQLGFGLSDGSASDPARGQDVKGTINGVEATGNGQLLTAREGNEGATNGYLLGGTGADFTSPVTIDSSNNNLRVIIDGTASGTITVPAGVYTTGNSLSDALQSAINSDPTLASASKAVDVQYDPDTATFGIFSVTKGQQSTVEISEIEAGAIDIFAMTTSTQGVPGKDAVGEADPAAGLILRVTGSQTGSRGSVTLVEGIFSRLEQTMRNLLDGSGLVTRREEALERELEDVSVDRSELEARLAAQEERLKAKFLFNDKIINQLKTTEDFLSQQFEILAAGITGKDS
ncbi:MAG: flagellar filament capping protein FliD [Saccharospirillum sp.]